MALIALCAASRCGGEHAVRLRRLTCLYVEGEFLMSTSNSRDIALAGDATGTGIGAALEHLVAHLNQSEHYDDVNLSLHVEQHADGGSRTCFTYRCYKHHQRR
jgi:hypothetical protein